MTGMGSYPRSPPIRQTSGLPEAFSPLQELRPLMRSQGPRPTMDTSRLDTGLCPAHLRHNRQCQMSGPSRLRFRHQPHLAEARLSAHKKRRGISRLWTNSLRGSRVSPRLSIIIVHRHLETDHAFPEAPYHGQVCPSHIQQILHPPEDGHHEARLYHRLPDP